MALEPFTRQEKIIAGQDLTPITRMEMFLKQYGGGGGGGGGSVPAAGGVTTLHINVTAVNPETMEATFTADKTPAEMEQASVNGPIWCVITFAAGIFSEDVLSFGVPPAWHGGSPAFGCLTEIFHDEHGYNTFNYIVNSGTSYRWILDITQFIG